MFVFCIFVMHYFVSIHLEEEENAGCFAIIVFDVLLL